MKRLSLPFRHFPHLKQKILTFVIALLAVYVRVSERDTDRLCMVSRLCIIFSPLFNILLRLKELHTALCETYGADLY